MAKKKSTTPPTSLHRYTARADDLKILGYVEAASDKEALKKARRLFDAASVELRDTDASTAEAASAEAPAPKAKKKSAAKVKIKKAAAAQAVHAADDDAATETAAEAIGKDKPSRRQARDRGAATPKKLSALDAAALVLAEAGQALTCQEMIAAMAEKAYWKSPRGLTPSATLYTAVTMLPKAS